MGKLFLLTKNDEMMKTIHYFIISVFGMFCSLIRIANTDNFISD